jgi:hypothetical protein
MNCSYNRQSSSHSSLGIILMGLRIAKVNQQPITQVLCQVPIKAGNHRGARFLVGAYYFTKLFGI